MAAKVRAEVLASARVVRLLASLNRRAGVVITPPAQSPRDHGRDRGVESHHVQHAASVGIRQGEAVGGHAYNDRLGVAGDCVGLYMTEKTTTMTGTMRATITPITPARVPELLTMIRELARFERLEHEVEATGTSLRKSFFGSRPAAGALVADCDGELAGYAIYFFTFSSFVGRPGIWLEDLYVRPQFRRQGLGRRMIEAVARVGANRNCGRFEWTALNWNRKALKFYRRLGARAMDEWVLLRLDAGGLRRLANGYTITKPKR
jgi:GNAT superfamily N-acetyltransferase